MIWGDPYDQMHIFISWIWYITVTENMAGMSLHPFVISCEVCPLTPWGQRRHRNIRQLERSLPPGARARQIAQGGSPPIGFAVP